jgi:hypothetical protein
MALSELAHATIDDDFRADDECGLGCRMMRRGCREFTGPGLTTLTRRPRGKSSADKVFASEISADLLAAYTVVLEQGLPGSAQHPMRNANADNMFNSSERVHRENSMASEAKQSNMQSR